MLEVVSRLFQEFSSSVRICSANRSSGPTCFSSTNVSKFLFINSIFTLKDSISIVGSKVLPSVHF